MSNIKNVFSMSGLRDLFLVTLIPIHIWSFIMAFNDLEWIAARTNWGDAIGVASYTMLIALVESFVVFLFFVVMGYFLPWNWKERKRIAVLSLTSLTVSFWLIVNRTFEFFQEKILIYLVDRVGNLENLAISRNLGFAVIVLLILLTISIPLVNIFRNAKFERAFFDLIERLKILSWMYLIVDGLGLLVILYRNFA